MTHPNDEEFTRNLNDRIRELENMTSEIEDQTRELNDQANKGTESDATAAESGAHTGETRTEGQTIFFTADVDAARPLMLSVTNNNGDIYVSSGDVSQVEIKAERIDESESDHEDWFFHALDNEITLRPNWQFANQVGDLANKLKTQLKSGFRSKDWTSNDFKFGMQVKYDLTIVVPKELAAESRVNVKTATGDGSIKDVSAGVDFTTANGDITISGITGDVSTKSANGDISVASATGDIHVNTANGDVKVSSVTGTVEGNVANGDVRLVDATGFVSLRSASGDISVKNVVMKGGRIATVSGDISLEGVTLGNSASYNFDTVAGDISIKAKVPAKGAALRVKTVSGDVSADGAWTKQDKKYWTLGDGDFGPQLMAKSVNGDISVFTEVDESLQLTDEVQHEKERPADSTHVETGRTESGDLNINMDVELERAKVWVKDLGSKLGSLLGDMDKNRSDDQARADATVDIEAPKSPESPKTPETPVAPEAPVAPKDPEQAAATAERRARLLEAVKNGEMTVDEALAQLDGDA